MAFVLLHNPAQQQINKEEKIFKIWFHKAIFVQLQHALQPLWQRFQTSQACKKIGKQKSNTKHDYICVLAGQKGYLFAPSKYEH